ncbi:MAG: hypothetical protein KC502_04850 [Myxococcales bacterium]|nr:hypothetical protein [Myxococcales bacterium]
MGNETNNQASEVLHLHERVMDRWNSGIGEGVTVEPIVTGRISGLLDSLPGLASLSGGFGPQALDIASLLAMESRFAYALSPDLRAMSIGDLADIVQVVLEEEEQVLEGLEQEVHRAKTKKARAAAAKKLAEARKKPKKAKQMGHRRRIAAVRKAIAKVRREASRLRTQQRADSRSLIDGQPSASGSQLESANAVAPDGGVYKSGDVGQVGTFDPGMLHSDRDQATPDFQALPDIGESLQILRSRPSHKTQGPRDVQLTASDLTASVTANHTVSRALRMAEWTADMAVLRPDTETVWDAPAPAVEASGDSTPQGPTPSLFATHTPSSTVTPEHRAAYERAERLAVQRQIHRREMTQRARLVSPAAAQQSAATTTPAGVRAVQQGQRPMHSIATPSLAAHQDRVALLRAATAAQGTRASQETGPFGQVLRQGPASIGADVQPLESGDAARIAGPGQLPALGGAVRLSASTLQRQIRGLRSIGANPTSTWDQFSAVLGADAPVTGVAASLQRWLDVSERLLTPQASRVAAPRQLDALGAGETLAIAAEPDLPPAGAPAWLSPVSREKALQQAAATNARQAAAKQAGTQSIATVTTPTVSVPGAAQTLFPTVSVPGAAQTLLSPSVLAGLAATPSVQRDAPVAQQGRRQLARTRGLLDASTEFASPTLASGAAQAIGRQGTQATAPVEGRVARPMGGSAVAAFTLASTLSARHFGGLIPEGTPAAWQPRVGPMLAAAESVQPAPGSTEELQQISDITGIPLDSLSQMGPGAVSQMRGALAASAGTGEWLLPGDDGYETWVAQQSSGSTDRPARPPRSTNTKGPIGDALARLDHAAAASGAKPQSGDRQAAPSSIGAVPHAAAAAIAQVVSQHARGGILGERLANLAAGDAPTAIGSGRSLLDFAAGTPQHESTLGVTPGGLSDAATPWILHRAMERLTPEARRSLMVGEMGTGDLLSIDHVTGDQATGDQATGDQATGGQATGDLPAGAATARATASRQATSAKSAVTASQAAAQRRPSVDSAASTVANLSPIHRALLKKLGAPSMAAAAQSLLGGAALDLREPMALRAALTLFGEQSTSQGEVADAFLSRFFGRPAPRETAAVGAEMTALSVGPEVASLPSSFDAGESAGSPSGDKQVVFSGLAGLAALREMKGSGVSESALLDLGQVESVTSRPSANVDSAAASSSSASAPGATAKAADKAGTAAKIHRFSPVGLSRTKQLLSGTRSGSRSVGGPRASRLGRSRVGYGAAGLGGGALLGLMPGDGGGLGEAYGGTGTSRRAERLGAAVQSRRAPRPGQVLRPMPHGTTERSYVSPGTSSAAGARQGYAGSAASGMASSELVSPVAAMQAAAAGSSSAGGTAAVKSQQASAMARVLSVTAAPTANVLPLVAPAARAIVAQAAAKPMSESIATSGANPSVAMPMAGHDADAQQSGGSGMGGDTRTQREAGAQPQQELDALAMKVARSVMVRIQRARERRGIHG